MALVPCPECQHNVSDKATQCPSCGYGVAEHFNPPRQTDSPQETESLVNPPSSGSSDEEKRFQIDALQVVTTCERALESPRMLISSVLAEAEGMLGGVRVNFRSFLSTEKYGKVEGYLMCLINSVKHVQQMDESTSNPSSDLLVGLVEKGHRMVLMNKAVRMPKAYIHDLRIILGAGYGTPDEVDKMLHKPEKNELDDLGKNGCLVLLAGMFAFSCCIAFGIVLL